MNTNSEKLIEDYLSIGRDEQTDEFAKPIEDEDIFGSIECDKTKETDTNNRPVPTPRAKERYKELAKGLIPRMFAADCDEDGMIDIGMTTTSEPESTARSIFEKAALKKVKDKYGLFKGQKLFWDKYNDYLLKKISADKRKRWDSFQNPPDRYDDEEELIEDEPKEENGETPEDGGPEDGEPEDDGPEDSEPEDGEPEDGFEEDELEGDELDEDELEGGTEDDDGSEDMPIGGESEEDEPLPDKPREKPKINESDDEPSEDEKSSDELSEDELSDELPEDEPSDDKLMEDELMEDHMDDNSDAD